MQFGELLGNERLKARLAASFARGAVSHCYLISGPAGSGKHTLARALCAALECDSPSPPCLHCPACRKVLALAHPDVITVDEPERRSIPVDRIRAASADAAIRPNEGKKKIYLIPRAGDLLAPAQNALLKIIEEPPPYGVFLLLAENPDQLLPTVRSRCVELALAPLGKQELLAALRQRRPDAAQDALEDALARSDGFLGRALALLEQDAGSEQTRRFAEAYRQGDPVALLGVCSAMEKWKRPELGEELRRWRALLAEALGARCAGQQAGQLAAAISSGRTAAELLAGTQALSQALDYLDANVGVPLICGFLSVRLRPDAPGAV